ncbi:MAG: cytochrome c [Anaerolineae bacterium]|jgi:cytochrome c2|nr:cytochrome c [Anaerolineae bacterium]
MMRLILALGSMLLLAACGTVATPIYERPIATPTSITAVEASGAAVAAQPTATTVPPTATPLPPTAEPTIVPTTAPTEAPTTAPAAGGSDPLEFLVSLAVPANGEALFNETHVLPDGQQWACSTCHAVAGDTVKIGPSLWGVGERAAGRVAGQGTYTYLYNSIRHPQDYVVEGYAGGQQMPLFDATVLNDAEVYDIIAYLMALR